MDVSKAYYAVAVLLAAVLFFVCRKWEMAKRIAISVLLPYFFLIIVSTLAARVVKISPRWNLTPFWTYRKILNSGPSAAWLKKEILFNILMLLPLGLLAPILLEKRKLLWTILIGLCFSVGIELLQFLTKRGLCETDDLIHNCIGVLIGYGIYSLGKLFMKQKTKKTDDAEESEKSC